MEPTDAPYRDPLLHVLQPGERIELALTGPLAQLRVTDRRLVVTEGPRIRLDIGYGRLRRIQFDLEAGRPAVLVIVPNAVTDEPQMLTIPRDDVHKAAEVLAFVAERMP